MSDNGGLSTSEGSPTSNVPLRAGKGWLYEGGIREPMIFKWPGITKAGSECSAPVISTDFYPTILEIAGFNFLQDQHVDGKSFIPLLKDPNAKFDRGNMFWHYPHYGNQGGTPGSVIRSGDYKLIEFYEDNRLELYDINKDIGEQNNLVEQMPEKAKELQNYLHKWLKNVKAKIPTPNPAFKEK
jgi:arylsulfatase A-like enzyme